MGDPLVDMPVSVRPRLPGGFRLPPFGMHQLLALIIVCVALWAVGSVWLGLQGVGQWVGSWQQNLHLHVYIPADKAAKIPELSARLKSIAGISEVRHVTPAEAAVWMQGWLGDTSLEADKLASKLPDSLELTLAGEANDFLFDDVRDEASRFGATINSEEAKLAHVRELLDSVGWVVWFATAMLALAMSLIVSNTLRMMILARADEVHLMRLLGAREWFVRMPLILEGMVIGGCAAIAGWLLLWPLVFGISGWTDGFGIVFEPFMLLLPMVAGGLLIGMLGAVIATARIVSPDSHSG